MLWNDASETSLALHDAPAFLIALKVGQSTRNLTSGIKMQVIKYLGSFFNDSHQ